MQQHHRDFYVEEYKQVRAEISVLLLRIENLAKFSLIVAAGTYGWLVTQGLSTDDARNWCLKVPKDLYLFGWSVPLLFASLSALAAFAAYWRGRQMASYVRTLESKLGEPGTGWETWLVKRRPVLTVAGMTYWIVLLIGTSYISHQVERQLESVTQQCKAAK